MVRFIRLNLEHDGFQVIEAHKGGPVLDMIRTQLPDLVLLDIMLPDIDGFELLRLIREANSVPVIMLTAK
ncbi:MAG: response regulator, partial [Anaerolineales bacterium]|nr:response regulator [Anaerolineales bacterium]